MKIHSSFPSKILYPEDILKNCGCPIEFQVDKLGINSRHILSNAETALSLAQNATEKLLDKEQIDRNNIELLLYITQTPERKIPQNSSVLQSQLGLSSKICSFDINLGCSGYVYALSTAKALMLSEGFQNALIVTSDCYSKIINRNDRDTAPIFGDAATATYITQDSFIGFSDFGTDGQGADMLCIAEDNYLYMNGRAIFNFMIKRIPSSVGNCLLKNRISLDDVDYFVFHQANKFLVQTLAQHLAVPKEKVCLEVENCGNTVSSSIPITLESLFKNNIRNKTILLSGFGVGLSWATTIIKT